MKEFQAPNYSYRCTVKRIIDGDTIDVFIDMGLYITTLKRLRFLEIDTEELRGGTVESKIRANEAKDRLIELCAKSTESFVMTDMDEEGKYGRLLAWFYVTIDGNVQCVNQVLIDEGFEKQ